MKASAAARASSRSALTAALSEVRASSASPTRSLMAKRWASTWAVSLSSWSCRRAWVSASLERASSDQVLSVSARAASASRIDEARRSSISARHSGEAVVGVLAPVAEVGEELVLEYLEFLRYVGVGLRLERVQVVLEVLDRRL